MWEYDVLDADAADWWWSDDSGGVWPDCWPYCTLDRTRHTNTAPPTLPLRRQLMLRLDRQETSAQCLLRQHRARSTVCQLRVLMRRVDAAAADDGAAVGCHEQAEAEDARRQWPRVADSETKMESRRRSACPSPVWNSSRRM